MFMVSISSFCRATTQTSSFEDFFMDPVNGWGVQTTGVQMAFNHLAKVLFTPDIKGWKLATDTLGNELTVENPYVSGDDYTTDITNGRYYSTAWSYGYKW